MRKEAIYPQYLNTPFKAVGFESDDLIIGFVSFGIGMLVRPMAGFICVILMVLLYRKAKRDKPRGFLQHLPYALGLKTFKGDCFRMMERIPDKSVDFVFIDPPYGTTRNYWDKPLNLALMWDSLKRIIKNNAAVLICSQLPFSIDVANSNRRMLRYEWIFEKGKATGHLNAGKTPLKAHENILVFYRAFPTYHPQKTEGHKPVHSYNKRHNADGSCYGSTRTASGGGNTDRYPRTIQRFRFRAGEPRYMPTQKPVDMPAYFIKTYTSPGATVLDFCMGSGTTGAACIETGRNFIGIELDALNYVTACNRIYTLQESLS